MVWPSMLDLCIRGFIWLNCNGKLNGLVKLLEQVKIELRILTLLFPYI
jgi:hypothetical protein